MTHHRQAHRLLLLTWLTAALLLVPTSVRAQAELRQPPEGVPCSVEICPADAVECLCQDGELVAARHVLVDGTHRLHLYNTSNRVAAHLDDFDGDGLYDVFVQYELDAAGNVSESLIGRDLERDELTVCRLESSCQAPYLRCMITCSPSRTSLGSSEPAPSTGPPPVDVSFRLAVSDEAHAALESVRRRMGRTGQRSFERCWEQTAAPGASPPDMTFNVTFSVEQNGRLAGQPAVELDVSSEWAPALLECVETQVSRWRFEPFEGEPLQVEIHAEMGPTEP